MVGAASTPIPSDPNTQFAEWRKTVEYRLKNLEGHRGSSAHLIFEAKDDVDSTALSNSNSDPGTHLDGDDGNGIYVDSTRKYEIVWHGQALPSATSLWTFDCRVQQWNDNVTPATVTDLAIDRFGLIDTSTNRFGFIHSSIFWVPAVTGRHVLYMRVGLAIGSGTITMISTANITRYMQIWDKGPA